MTGDLIARAFAAFQPDVSVLPPLTLRGGNDVDGYERPQPFHVQRDEPTDAYLEQFAFWGLGYLDAQSWRHYLPRLIDYALRHPADPRMVTEALVRSLRPPDRYPPRLATLTGEQESVIREFLEHVALEDAAPDLQTDAQQALEEWWLPNPRARPTAEDIAARRAGPVTYRSVGSDICRLSLPDTLTGSGRRDIPEEARRVEMWGGHICFDVHTVVAVNVTPLSVRSLRQAVTWRSSLFRDPVPTPMRVTVPGARHAEQLEGMTHGESPAEPQLQIFIFAETGDELVTVSIQTWDRPDVRSVVERIASSLVIKWEQSEPPGRS